MIDIDECINPLYNLLLDLLLYNGYLDLISYILHQEISLQNYQCCLNFYSEQIEEHLTKQDRIKNLKNRLSTPEIELGIINKDQIHLESEEEGN